MITYYEISAHESASAPLSARETTKSKRHAQSIAARLFKKYAYVEILKQYADNDGALNSFDFIAEYTR